MIRHKGVIGSPPIAACLLALCAHAFADFSPPAQITVVTDDNYPPYLFRADDGGLQGILKDKWELWSRKTGVAATLEGMEWAKAQRSILGGAADVIEAMSYTEARAQLYEYSPAWATIETRVYFHRSIGGINDVASMRGFAVGTKDGSACTDWLRERGVEVVRPYPDSDVLVRAAGAGEMRLFCMDAPAAQYFLFKRHLADEFRQTAPLYAAHFHWAVVKGRAELRDFIQGGFDRISAQELREIDERWLGNPLRLPIDTRYFYYFGFAALALGAAAALLILWNRSLRLRVSSRTAELNGQNQVLALIAEGAPLAKTLDALARWIEAQSRDMLCTVLLLDEDGVHMRHGAAPSLPERFMRAIDGEAIGERAGSCGTAAYRRKPVIVEDIATDPLWQNYRHIAAEHGLRACWSTPIFDAQNNVLGTFAIYFREPRRPAEHDLRLIDMATGTAAIAISRKRAAEQLQQSLSRMRELSRRLVEVEETERRSINRELHDRVGQNLSALQLSLSTLRLDFARGTPPALNSRLDDAQALLEVTSNQVRDVMADLRPAALDDYGLLAALRHHAAAVAARLGNPVAVEGIEIEPRLPLATETALFRIVQEALNNTAKHARAHNVKVILSATPASVRLSVIDDGSGFDAARPAQVSSYGVTTMHERAAAVDAQLRIESAPGKGTRVEVEVARSPA